MNNEIIDEVKCVTFLKQIRYSIDEDRMFQNTEIKIDVTHNTMSLILLKEQALDFQEIEYIVKLIDENELFSFNDLFNCGWCSSSKVTEASPGKVEFSWLKIGGKCDCATCSLRFEKMSKTPYGTFLRFKSGTWIFPEDIDFLAEYIYHLLNNQFNVNEMYVYSNYLTKAKIVLDFKKRNNLELKTKIGEAICGNKLVNFILESEHKNCICGSVYEGYYGI